MKPEIKPKVNLELELPDETIKWIKEAAKELNMSEENLMEKILENAIAEEIEVSEFQKLPDEEWFKRHWILTENGVPKARVIPL